MFAKKNRIPRKKIDEMFEKKIKGKQNPFFLIKEEKNNLTQSRFSVIVSKKIEKSAVKRNNIKRRVISQIKKTESKTGKDFIVILKNNLKELDYLEIKNKLAELIK